MAGADSSAPDTDTVSSADAAPDGPGTVVDVLLLDTPASQPDAPDAPDALADARTDAGSSPDALDASMGMDAWDAAADVFVPPPVVATDGPGVVSADGGAPSVECLRETYGGPGVESFYDLQVLPDGYVLAGVTSADTSSYPDGWIFRLDGSGSVVWSRAIGGPWRDLFSSVLPTRDGGFAASGLSQVRGPGIDADSVSALVVRTGADGALRWSRYWSPPDGSARAVAVFESGAELLMVGNETHTGAATADVFAIRFDVDGGMTGERHYDLGPIGEVCAATQTGDGGLLIAGRTFEDYTATDTLIALRLAPGGEEIWRRTLGTTDTRWSAAGERPCGVVELPGGGAAIATTVATQPFAQSRRVVVLAADGSTDRDLSFAPEGDHRTSAITTSADGQLLVIGPSISTPNGLDFEAIRLNDDFTLRWTAGYGGSDWDYPRAIRPAPDGSFLVAGETYSAPGLSSQGWILRLTSDGQFVCPW